MTDQLESQLKTLRNELYLCFPPFVDDACARHGPRRAVRISRQSLPESLN